MVFLQLMLLGVIAGRPYGGVGFLWKKCLDASVCDGKKEYALINVYLPYDCDDNREDYGDCLAKLNVVVHASPS